MKLQAKAYSDRRSAHINDNTEALEHSRRIRPTLVKHIFVLLAFTYIIVIQFVVLFIILSVYSMCYYSASSYVESVIKLCVKLPRSVRGISTASPSIVVYRHVPGGFGNNMMGLVTSYVFAMKKNAILYCKNNV